VFADWIKPKQTKGKKLKHKFPKLFRQKDYRQETRIWVAWDLEVGIGGAPKQRPQISIALTFTG